MDRFKTTKKASTFGIIGNIILLIIKGIIGIITKSQAMIADSLNSAGDIFSSLMTYIGNKIASMPKDEDHNLGHGKAEYGGRNPPVQREGSAEYRPVYEGVPDREQPPYDPRSS